MASSAAKLVRPVRNASLYRALNRAASQFSTSGTKVGLIGLGNMGASMASNLVKSATHPSDVCVYDVMPENIEKLVAEGATGCPDVASLAAKCDTIITMVPATAHVTSLLKDANGIFAHAKKGTLIIDCSTIDPIASSNLSNEAATMGLRMIDAPVSGGVTGAAAGTLTFMVGGSDDNVSSATPTLDRMGAKIIHCGAPGAGGVTKLCNNLSLAISMIGTCEAMALGKRLGMDSNKLAEVMNTSTARCWSSDTYNPVPGVIEGVPANRDYAGGFGAALMEKDLTLAMNAASQVKARLPLGGSAHQLYGLLCENELGDRDFGVVYKYLMNNYKGE
jgi:3-hydroxyisobutyrate dehydrogenase